MHEMSAEILNGKLLLFRGHAWVPQVCPFRVKSQSTPKTQNDWYLCGDHCPLFQQYPGMDTDDFGGTIHQNAKVVLACSPQEVIYEVIGGNEPSTGE